MMRREYVLTRTGLVTVVGFVGYLAVRLGWLGMTPAVQSQVVDVLNVTLPVAVPMLGALWARLGVTPVYDPQSSVAVPLIPAPAVVPPAPQEV